MNSIRNKLITLPTIPNISSQQNKKIKAVQKANKAKGTKQKITEDNVDTINIMFLENLGCSIEECPENYTFQGQARSGEGKPFLSENTNKSFENSDDSFYEPDCQDRKPKKNKQKQTQATQFSEDILDLVEDLTSEVTSQEPLQSIQQEGSFSASSNLAADTLSQTGFAETNFTGQTRNVTKSTKTGTKFYKLSN